MMGGLSAPHREQIIGLLPLPVPPVLRLTVRPGPESTSAPYHKVRRSVVQQRRRCRETYQWRAVRDCHRLQGARSAAHLIHPLPLA
jgi:hypothetical protein